MHTDELIGTVLDRRYRIERLLGEGGMGMVYLGEHERRIRLKKRLKQKRLRKR